MTQTSSTASKDGFPALPTIDVSKAQSNKAAAGGSSSSTAPVKKDEPKEKGEAKPVEKKE